MDYMRYNRARSRGYKIDPPVLIHPMILIGAGEMLTPEFKQKWGITHVLNCAEDEMCPSWFSKLHSDKYTCLEAIDSLNVNILVWYPKFRDTLLNYLRRPECSRVFVHCQCGINRSAFLTLMFVCDIFAFPFENTERIIIQTRPCALTNPAFRLQVMGALSKKAS
jgi:hypothetical protein